MAVLKSVIRSMLQWWLAARKYTHFSTSEHHCWRKYKIVHMHTYRESSIHLTGVPEQTVHIHVRCESFATIPVNLAL